MSEIRVDAFTRRRVLLVHERGDRPSDWAVESPPNEKNCPFCEGQEDRTPPEVWALRDGPPNSPGWQIRVIPNKYPISEAHELIIETPEHDADLPDLAADHLENVVRVYRERMRALAQQKRWRYLLLFKNYGRAAGASRAHPHAQLVGLASVPPLIRRELHIARRHFQRRQSCLYCEALEQELSTEERVRVIEANEEFAVWSSRAARVPFECWILPRRHQHDFLASSPQQIKALSVVLSCTLARLRRVLGSRYAYNFYVHTAPPYSRRDSSIAMIARSYHWHVEILPRLAQLAGLEWGSGFYINSLHPEEAARRLRQALDR